MGVSSASGGAESAAKDVGKLIGALRDPIYILLDSIQIADAVALEVIQCPLRAFDIVLETPQWVAGEAA